MSVSCNPSELARLAACLGCLTTGVAQASKAALICEWATGGAAPIAPGDLDIDGVMSSNGNTVLVWTQAGPAPDNYEIWRSINGAPFALLITISGALLTYIDLAVMNAGDEYDYQVRAVTGGRNSAFAGPVGATNQIVFNGTLQAALAYPYVVVAYGNLQAINMPNLISFSAPLLHTETGVLGEALECANNGVQTTFDIPNIVAATQLNGINLPLVTAMSFADLVTVLPVRLILAGSGYLTFSFPNLNSTNGFEIHDNPALTSIAAPALNTDGILLQVNSNASLTAVNLNALVSVGSDVDFSNSASLVSLSFPNLTTACTIADPGGFPSSPYFGAGPTGRGVAASPLLANLSIPVLVFPDNGLLIDFQGCALTAASVELILRRGVISGVTMDDFELSGGTNAGLASLSLQGQADYAALVLAGNTVVLNP